MKQEPNTNLPSAARLDKIWTTEVRKLVSETKIKAKNTPRPTPSPAPNS